MCLTLYPTINISTRITATLKTIQFLIIRDQATSFEVPKIRKLHKEKSLTDITQIGCNNYLKTYQNDTDLHFELYFRKSNILDNNLPLIT